MQQGKALFNEIYEPFIPASSKIATSQLISRPLWQQSHLGNGGLEETLLTSLSEPRAFSNVNCASFISLLGREFTKAAVVQLIKSLGDKRLGKIKPIILIDNMNSNERMQLGAIVRR
ncbi:hypothetical protein CDAR_445651 [Caerostris darwini]|uniref:Uncharacterized protein n=1 Tax=Caerostris darwini TaxID=1538125 RepID=A0AAV4U7G7_9ARAC|nr:hypothetical protein CDAR_445651 [Caerostris darwini]